MANFCVRCGIPLAIGNTSDFCEEHAEKAPQSPDATIRCPCCSEKILASAKKCKHCGEFLERKEQAIDIGYLPPNMANTLPAMVRSELKKLPQDKINSFLDEYRRRCKSTSAAYSCWLFFGVHYAYLGRWGMQVIFWIAIGGAGVWWLIDLFRIPALVRDANQDIAISVLRDLKIVGGL